MRSNKTTLGVYPCVLIACWISMSVATGQLSDDGAKVQYHTLKLPETRYSRNGFLETQLTADFSLIELEVPDVTQVATEIQSLFFDLYTLESQGGGDQKKIDALKAEIKSAEKKLDTILAHHAGTATAPGINPPLSFFTRVYEDSLPGPTMRLLPGDDLKLVLSNQLYIPPSYREQLLENLQTMVSQEGLKLIAGDLTASEIQRYVILLVGSTKPITLAEALKQSGLTLDDLEFGRNGDVSLKKGDVPFGKIVGLNFLTPKQVQNITDTSLSVELNRTNLHTHGLHVWPKAYVDADGNARLASDDVLINLLPPGDPLAKQLGIAGIGESKGRIVNERLQYLFEVPVYHAPGTHWYHAHKDGSVAIQVQNGMAGALIIDEPAGQEILKGAKEQVMVLQEVNNIIPANRGEGRGKLVGGKRPLVSTINGQYQPEVHMHPGEIQRWRIVNAGSNTSAFNYLSIVDNSDPKAPKELPFYVVAFDGVNLSNEAWKQQLKDGGYKSTPTPRDATQNRVFVAAGNRVDILFQAPASKDSSDYQEPTRYQIVANQTVFYPGTDNTAKATGKSLSTGITTKMTPYSNYYYTAPVTQDYIDNPIPLPLFDSNKIYPGDTAPEIVSSRPVYVLNIGTVKTPNYIFKVPLPETPGGQPEVIGHVEVSGLPIRDLAIPESLPAHTFVNARGEVEKINYLVPVHEEDVTARKTLVFDVDFETTDPTHPVIELDDNSHRVTIDGTVFDANAIQVQVGDPTIPVSKELPIDHQGKTYSVEEWTVLNNSDQSHPFHIHVNPFQVVEIAHFVKTSQAPGTSQGNTVVVPYTVRGQKWFAYYDVRRWDPEVARWHDVITLPPRGWVKMRSRFLDFQGTYVLHCHILNHEDQGMMLTVNVGNPADPELGTGY